MNILAVSDIELDQIYSPKIKTRYKDANLVISCGDLPPYYLDFIVSMLDVPLYYVRGNHSPRREYRNSSDRPEPWGAIDLHSRTVCANPLGLLMAGIEGSVRYNNGDFQYTQFEMWTMVWELVPNLLINRIRRGRFLDIFVSHAPPWKINDQDDLPHQGIKAFRWLDSVFHPRLHLHGHIHIYQHSKQREFEFGSTRVINVCGSQELVFDPSPGQRQ
jgi:uncharacterized protein